MSRIADILESIDPNLSLCELIVELLNLIPNTNAITDMQNRDYNLAAKVLLLVSMLFVLLSTISLCSKLLLPTHNAGVVIVEITTNVFILIFSIFTLLRRRWALILLIVSYMVRFIGAVPYGSDANIAYYLGGNFAVLIRDFALFVIALCFKKNGISGWKSMLSNTERSPEVSIETQETEAKTTIEQSFTETTTNNKPPKVKVILIAAILLCIGSFGGILAYRTIENAKANTPTKYLVNLGKFSVIDKETYDKNKEQLKSQNPPAPIYAMVKYDAKDGIYMQSYYYVLIEFDASEYPYRYHYDEQIWSGERLMRNIDKLLKEYPTIQIYRLDHLNGYYDLNNFQNNDNGYLYRFK